MKHVKKFLTLEEYNKFISSDLFIKPNVSKIGKVLQYHKKVIYKLFDILWANSNGDKKVDSNILDPSEEYIPIGMCVVATNFFGEGEPARFISLKYMSDATPDTGDFSFRWINWGNLDVNMDGIPLYDSNYSKYQNIDTSKEMFVYGTENENNLFPSVFDSNGNWNLAELGEKNQYIITDVNGKHHSNILLNYATDQPNWKTDTTITQNGGKGYAPAACCCWRYHTLGTQQGDWYLPACGELLIFAEKREEFIIKLNLLRSQYSNYVTDNFNYGYLWTSTSKDTGDSIRYVNKKIGNKHRGDDDNVFAFIQL